MITYCIVRIIESTILERPTAAIVYGPYDEDGARRAYRSLVSFGLGEGAHLEVRALVPTGDSPLPYHPEFDPSSAATQALLS